jgi:RNA polymerase sigma factor (sigma-70 family)
MALALRETEPASDEHELVSAVRLGDDRAFEQLFSSYRRRISGYVYALVGDYGRAEDITQEVFISALRRLRETDQAIAFKPWIYEIARNACIDEFRRSRRATVVPLEDEQAERALHASALADTGSPEARWESKRQLRNLFGAFSGLSQVHHQILVLRELEGLSYAEIADRMGISRTMVESTLFRARRRLSQEYAELDSGRRCEYVQAALDERCARGLARLGLRERRRIAGHLTHCQDCQRHARMAGVDSSALQEPRVGEKVAALSPFGWLPAALRWARSLSGGRRGAGAAARAAQRASVMAENAGTGVAMGRAIAAAIALFAVAGGPPGAVGTQRSSGLQPRVQPALISAPAGPVSARRHVHARPARRAARARRASIRASGASHRPRRLAARSRAQGHATTKTSATAPNFTRLSSGAGEAGMTSLPASLLNAAAALRPPVGLPGDGLVESLGGQAVGIATSALVTASQIVAQTGSAAGGLAGGAGQTAGAQPLPPPAAQQAAGAAALQTSGPGGTQSAGAAGSGGPAGAPAAGPDGVAVQTVQRSPGG